MNFNPSQTQWWSRQALFQSNPTLRKRSSQLDRNSSRRPKQQRIKSPCPGSRSRGEERGCTTSLSHLTFCLLNLYEQRQRYSLTLKTFAPITIDSDFTIEKSHQSSLETPRHLVSLARVHAYILTAIFDNICAFDDGDGGACWLCAIYCTSGFKPKSLLDKWHAIFGAQINFIVQ